MSLVRPFSETLHLFISLIALQSCSTSLSSLEMNDLLFIERRSHSSYELMREFFNRTLLPLCDVTAEVCDINCCNDEDCEGESLDAYACSEGVEQFTVDPIFSDPLYCSNNISSKDYSLDPILCYEVENSPYLGEFFPEDDVLKRRSLELWLERLESEFGFGWFPNTLNSPKPHRRPTLYKYGVDLVHTDSGSPVRLPTSILGKGYCFFSSPIKFLVDSSSMCTSKIDPDSCLSNPNFNLKSYFHENEAGELVYPEVYSGQSNSRIAANITIQCGGDLFEIDDFSLLPDNLEDCSNLKTAGVTKLNKLGTVCEHVVTQVEMFFVWFENLILSVNITVTVSDVPMNYLTSVTPSRRIALPVVNQKFVVKFKPKNPPRARVPGGGYHEEEPVILYMIT